MIALIVSYRLRSWLRPEQFETTDPMRTERALPTIDLALESDLEDEEKKNQR